MKSIKCMITSVICLILAIFSLYAFTTGKNPAPGIIGFYGFLVIFLVFFILGWVIKDKTPVSKSRPEEKNDDNKN